ncbi:HsdM N-terminal domain [Rothia kristinae]|uniref:type I restriction-modification system subunit M N-terminal domain-containing protein n=1 Tax=Rothia kristinae TaxID=37923 RepID=UPI000774276C|nr:type I restriction-modification system subunit M N-terminal domain-containing protein [Rothia kristinae]SQC37611.1 HsdM N-terminal domain [Rothia kristinae]
MFNHASFIRGAADILRGTYKQHEYGDVILPFTVLFRLDAVLEAIPDVLHHKQTHVGLMMDM